MYLPVFEIPIQPTYPKTIHISSHMILDHSLIDAVEAPQRLAFQKFYLALMQAQNTLASDLLTVKASTTDKEFSDMYNECITQGLGVVVFEDNDQPMSLANSMAWWIDKAMK